MDEYKQHFLLRAAWVMEGRPMTLYEQVHTIESKEKYAPHRQFLIQPRALLPDQLGLGRSCASPTRHALDAGWTLV